jgi:hypothetical protein
MKVLALKKTKSHRIDWMEYAIQRAFSQENDIVTFATIKVGGLLKTVTNIKELIKQYQPDVVIAKGLLASILFFELPKSIKKIIINPLLLHEGTDGTVRISFTLQHGDLRMMDWLERKTEEFFQSDDTTQMENTYCIVRNFLNNFSQYDKLVVRYSKAKQENRPNNFFLANENEIEKTELLGHCQHVIGRAREYFDPDFELINIGETLKNPL